MSEAQRLCDRIAIIHRGSILALGGLEELRERTGRHYLEDIFIHYVRGVVDLEAPEAGSSALTEGTQP